MATVAVTVAIVKVPFGGGDDRAAQPGAGVPRSTGVGSAFAYATERELVVMRDETVLSKVPRIFDAADPARNKFAWTDDGTRVVVMSDRAIREDDPGQAELIFVNARTGEQRRVPCAYCHDFTPVGGSTLFVMAYVPGSGGGSDAKYRFYTLNLGSLDNPSTVDFPAGISSYSARSFLTSTSGSILTRQGVSGRGNTYFEQLELGKVGSTSKIVVGRFESNDYMPAAAIRTGNGDVTFAVAFRPNPGECVASFPVYLIDGAGKAVKTDLSAAYPPGYIPGEQGGIEVHDLWWGRDGHLRATLSSWTCDNTKRAENDKQIPSSPSALWRLDGGKWARDGGAPATIVRELGGDVRLDLVIPECIGTVANSDPTIYCNVGSLYRVGKGARRLVADQVLSLSTPPPAQS